MVSNRAEIARRYELSRARVTQIMRLLTLPKKIQSRVVALPTEQQRRYSGRRLRELLPVRDEQAQVEAFEHLVRRGSKSTEA